MRFKLNLYKSKVKRELKKSWYALMKPLATIIMKIEDKKRKSNEEKTDSIVSGIDQEGAIERLFDVMVREFAKYPDTEWSISVAEYGNNDDSIETIKEYMTDQEYDKYLGVWAYRLPFRSFEINKSLTYKFIDRVRQHGAFKVEKVEYQTYVQKYVGTYIITLTDEYLSILNR